MHSFLASGRPDMAEDNTVGNYPGDQEERVELGEGILAESTG